MVKIRTRPDINILDYEKGQTLDIQHPDNPLVEFPIERAKYFNFICDDIDAHQADVQLMSEWSQDAGQQMKVKIDSEGLATVYADGHASNVGLTAGLDSSSYNMGVSGTPYAVTKDNVLDFMSDMTSVLDEQNVPETSRWYAIPSWMANLIKKSEIKDVSMTGDSKSPIRHGRIGNIDNNPILKSNQIHKVTDGDNTCYYPMAGNKAAITFAAQMNEMDSLKSERTFGQLIRGLNVHDYKTIKEQALVVGYVYKA